MNTWDNHNIVIQCWNIMILYSIIGSALLNVLNAQKLKSKPFQPTQEMLNIIELDVKKIEEGWKKNDFTVSIKEGLLHPKIIEMAGGKEALIESTHEQMQAMGNFKVESFQLDKPKDFTIYNDVIYGIIPFKMTLNFEGAMVNSDGYLLVLSENQGKKFYYFDSSGLKDPFMDNLFPDIKIAAKLP